MKVLQDYVDNIDHELLYKVDLSDDLKNGTYFPPHAYKCNGLKPVEQEVFGPILHITTYKYNQLEEVLDAIHSTNFGLTLGIHSRLESTINYLLKKCTCW